MKYFFDTEFIEHVGGIKLISLGIEAEDGRTFYAESSSFNYHLANEWVKQNVLPKLKYRTEEQEILFFIDKTTNNGINMYGSESLIKENLLVFLSENIDPNPEFYAYFASYDWVVFARLFGRLVDKPKHFPMWVIDLKQMMWERGLSKEWKQEVCPDPEQAHNALIDAQWNKKLHSQIILHPIKS